MMSNNFLGNYWWFGVNNKTQRSKGDFSHVIFPEIENFIKGYRDYFDWPRQKKHHQAYYDDIDEEDQVLIWMGDGQFEPWGLIGIAYIEKVFRSSRAQNEKFRLRRLSIPKSILQPYPNHNPQITDSTTFLEMTFTLNFEPLFTTFRLLGKHDKTTSPITIALIQKQQFDLCKKILEK